MSTGTPYELAKQLKDAGYIGDYDLSSLIKACGDNLYSLQHSMTKEVGEWYVIYKSDEVNPPAFYSNTPEESLALLWLSINKK